MLYVAVSTALRNGLIHKTAAVALVPAVRVLAVEPHPAVVEKAQNAHACRKQVGLKINHSCSQIQVVVECRSPGKPVAHKTPQPAVIAQQRVTPKRIGPEKVEIPDIGFGSDPEPIVLVS